MNGTHGASARASEAAARGLALAHGRLQLAARRNPNVTTIIPIHVWATP